MVKNLKDEKVTNCGTAASIFRKNFSYFPVTVGELTNYDLSSLFFCTLKRNYGSASDNANTYKAEEKSYVSNIHACFTYPNQSESQYSKALKA